MPEFAPGETRTAVAPITVSPPGLACEAELFLGPNDTTKVATSGRKAFTSTGASQPVELPVVMPPEGTHHVYIDVLVEGEVIAVYHALEDVVIVAPAKDKFYMRPDMAVWVEDGSILGQYWRCHFTVVITNKGSAPGTHTVSWHDNIGVISGSKEITLEPYGFFGPMYSWIWEQLVDFRGVTPPYIMFLEGDWEENNFSKGEARPGMEPYP